MTEPCLSATVGANGTDLVTTSSYDELVRSNLLRYHGTKTSITGRVVGVLPGDPALVERHRVLTSRRFASQRAVDAFILSFIASGVSVGVTTAQYESGHLALAYVVLAWAIMLGVGGMFVRYGYAQDRIRAIARDLTGSRDAVVPRPVADAYRRIASAAHEIGPDTEDDEQGHSREAIASVRLAADGAREIVALLHHHGAAGTLHADAAKSMTSEIYRLASEVDAYLTLHNAQRFAPGEGDAFGVISSTSQLTFKPRESAS